MIPQSNFRPLFETAYEDAFVRHSHELVWLGYRRLVPRSLADLDETAITGRLVDAMEAALNAPDHPEWATHVTAIDDQPESIGGKTGKRRPRVDVTIRCINPRPSISFRFEAKRLHATTSLNDYLGSSGLLALVTGYYGDLRWAGMLGYVQADTCPTWAARIKAAIQGEPAKYFAPESACFATLGLSTSEPVFCSEHEHGTPPSARTITHTLLPCA